MELTIVNPYAAGIDVGDREYVVAVPDVATQRVKTFGTMSCDITAIIEWLKQCEVDTVAMESRPVFTGSPYSACLCGKALTSTWSMRLMSETLPAVKQMKVMRCGFKNYIVAGC